MNTLIFVSAFCIVAVLVYMARYSGRVRVEQTRVMDAPLAAVYAQVLDLQRWRHWSPWLDIGADASLKITDGEPGHCQWESARMGSGTVEQVRAVDRQRIEQRLRLRHPFAVSAKGLWTFKEVAGKTELTWTLRGRVAFSMRAFSPTVQGSLALECRYGLDRLAHMLEPGSTPRYTISHLGVRTVAATHYVYRDYQGAISGLPQARRNTIADLQQALSRCGQSAAGAPMVRFFKTHIKLRTTVCHIGIPVEHPERVASLPVREMAAHSAYVVRLQGSEAALEIAWYLAMQRMAAEKMQPDQRLPPFESYLVNSEGTPQNDRVIELHLPILQR